MTLKLTTEEARTLYHALIHASTGAENAIATAAAFPESDILQAAGKRAEERKASIDALVRKLLGGLPHEEWGEITRIED